jgi:hypothetical protein
LTRELSDSFSASGQKRASQTSRSKRKQSKASPKFKSKGPTKKSKTSKLKETAQRAADHEGPSEPGLSLAGLRGGGLSDSEPETLVSEGEDEARDEAEEKEEEPRPRGIIGIDVGTTFSGLSFPCKAFALLKHLQPYLSS